MVGTQQARASSRLSSGFRINSAADDAAGLGISEKMRSQIRGLDQASRNGQDGISLIQTAEGAMSTINEMITRIRELVIQASNDTNIGGTGSDSDRMRIQEEINQLVEEIDATVHRTEFNTRTLLDGSLDSNNFNFLDGISWADITGAGANPTNTAAALNATQQASLLMLMGANASAFASSAGNISEAWVRENMVNFRDLLGAQSATVSVTQSTQFDTTGEILDTTATVSTTVNGVTTIVDPTYTDLTITTIDTFSVAVQDTTATVSVDATVAGTFTVSTAAAAQAGFHVSNTTITDTANTNFLGTGTARDVAIAQEIANFLNSVRTNTAEALQPDQGVSLWFQVGANVDQGVELNIQRVGSDVLGIGDGNGVAGISVLSVSGEAIQDAWIEVLDDALAHVTAQRSNLGAMQNRLEFTIQNLDIASENLSAAESRIRDADMALEMMRLTQSNVLQQAATAMLAQANQSPQSILQLLG